MARRAIVGIGRVFQQERYSAPVQATRGVDFLGGKLNAHHGVVAERRERTGARRQVSDPDRAGLRARDRRRADAGDECRADNATDEGAAREGRFKPCDRAVLPLRRLPALVAPITVAPLCGKRKSVERGRSRGRERRADSTMNLGIRNLKVLVTAGAGGIGLEVARAFVAEGARVHVCDVDSKALRALAKTDPKLTRSTCDVSDRRQVAKLFRETLGVFKGLDVLVNNAGIAGPTGKVDEIAPEDWDRCLAVDITGQFNCTRLAVPHLRKSKNASIVNLSSAAGRLGFPLRTPYSASKWAVVGFTKSLAAELGPEGIRVNAIQPGIVSGERIDRVMENKAKARGISPAEMLKEALSVVSMRTTVTPQQIADAIVFICSERGRSISGQEISICGDSLMLP